MGEDEQLCEHGFAQALPQEDGNDWWICEVCGQPIEKAEIDPLTPEELEFIRRTSTA